MLRFPPRRILAAVDASEVSVRAWRAARDAAERFGAVLDAVWFEPPPAQDLSVYDAPLLPDPGWASAAEAALRRRLGPGARLHCARGEPARSLARLARDRRCDLIVVGTHRRRGAARLMFGSVSEDVARRCPCPVLVVPARPRPIRRVLAPVNAEPYARRGLLAAALVARAYKARLTVLRVSANEAFGPAPRRLLESRIAELPAEVRRDVEPEVELRAGDPVDEILRAERGRDLVVLVAHRKSLIGDWALGTTAERVLRRTRVPLLIVPPAERR